MLYVAQVSGGQERRACQLVKRLVDPSVLQECFVAQAQVMRRVKGEWRLRTEIMLPGYLFLRTKSAEKLAAELVRVPAFTRLLGSEEAFVPLLPQETMFIDAVMSKDDGVMEMSEGVIEGDKVTIVKGPLKSLKGLITKIDRHRRCAYITVPMFERKITARVGLEIVQKIS